jgi:tetratricopeptide (TPR) repeat protein
MAHVASDAPIGREKQLSYVSNLQTELRHGGTGWVWITGDAGCGKTDLLRACVEGARRAGWEVLEGQCSDETRTDPYGPFLSTLGLCFDKAGRLINDRSVYSIVDQISLDDVFDAVTDIPGMGVVAFGIKVGMRVFEARRRPRAKDDLLNRNFEFILQVLKQIDSKRRKPVFLALDDVHLASATTYALLEYILTRIEGARLLVVATWEADSAEAGLKRIRKAMPKPARPDRVLHLPPLPKSQMQALLDSLSVRPLPKLLAETLIEFSQGRPGRLLDSLRLVEQEGESCLDGFDRDTTGSPVQTLVARQVAQLSDNDRALLQCAALIGQRVPVGVIAAPPLCTYLGMGERALLSSVIRLADSGVLLTWDGEAVVRFTSPFVRRFLCDQDRQLVARRDHERIAESWQAATGEAHPAQLATHYLAGGNLEHALEFALQSAEDLMRSAAYPEAVQSYELALEALSRLPSHEDRTDTRLDILQSMSLAAEQAGDWAQAVTSLQEALDLSEGDTARQAEIHAGLGWLHFQRGEIQSALSDLERSAELYASLDDVLGRVQVDYYLGAVYSRQKEWQRAVACFQRYLRVSDESGFEEGRASALIELGNLHRLQRHWQEAEQYLREGIGLAKAEGDYVVLAQAYNLLGSCYAWQGKPESVDMLQQALDIVSTRTKQPAQEAQIQNTLAETLVRANRWGEAEAAFRASAAIKERLGDRTGLAITYGGLGRLYFRQWRFDQAIEYLQRDIDLLADEFDANVAWIQQWTNIIGEALRLQGRPEAKVRFEEALSLAERIPDEGVRVQSQAFTQMLLARLAIDRGDMDAAEKMCARALDVLAGTWADGEIQRTAARLARKQGDVERARQHLERAHAAAERGEDIDRGLVCLEHARLSLDEGDAQGAHEWAEQVVCIAQRLHNIALERQANELVDTVSVRHGYQD